MILHFLDFLNTLWRGNRHRLSGAPDIYRLEASRTEWTRRVPHVPCFLRFVRSACAQIQAACAARQIATRPRSRPRLRRRRALARLTLIARGLQAVVLKHVINNLESCMQSDTVSSHAKHDETPFERRSGDAPLTNDEMMMILSSGFLKGTEHLLKPQKADSKPIERTRQRSCDTLRSSSSSWSTVLAAPSSSQAWSPSSCRPSWRGLASRRPS